MDLLEIILAAVAIGGSVVTHLLTKRKFVAEAAHSELANVDKAIAIWRKMAEDLKKEHAELKDEYQQLEQSMMAKMDEVLKENSELKRSISTLKRTINDLKKELGDK